jgi:hypothetical protein
MGRESREGPCSFRALKGPVVLQSLVAHADEGLTGTKLGCGEGGCGACTVVVSRITQTGPLEHIAVNACLCPLYSVVGSHVTTIEGLGNPRIGLHPIQVCYLMVFGVIMPKTFGSMPCTRFALGCAAPVLRLQPSQGKCAYIWTRQSTRRRK